jgi:hypothetical protein
MPDREDRGTTEDTKWIADDHTGGNDSGTSRIDPNRLDEPQGPDRTAEALNAIPTRELLHQPDPSMRPPVVNRSRDAETVTDESGRIASTDERGEDAGGARNPAVSGATGEGR